jgi:hypothetical protein
MANTLLPTVQMPPPQTNQTTKLPTIQTLTSQLLELEEEFAYISTVQILID